MTRPALHRRWSRRAMPALGAAAVAGLIGIGVTPAIRAAQTGPSAVAALGAARDDVRTMLEGGQLPSVPPAAFRARDAALALEPHLGSLPAATRVTIANAIRTIVLAAWRIDAASDAGDLAVVEHTAKRLTDAVATLQASLPAATGGPAPAAATGAAAPTWTDIRPILAGHCAGCHDALGAPTRLLDYAAAVAAAPVMRARVMSEAMPPWFVDPEGPPVVGTQTMEARALDALLRWTAQGTPEGTGSTASPEVTPATGWTAGPPTAVVEVPAVTLQPGGAGTRTQVDVESGVMRETWIRAADILVSDPSALRAAVVAVEDGPVIAAWMPGEAPRDTPPNTAFRIPAGARLRVDLRFRPLPAAGAPRMVTVRIGLYGSTAPPAGRGLTTRTFDDTLILDRAASIVALRVTQREPLDTVDVVASAPDGRSLPLLRLRASHPGWDRRYWLANPVALQAGTSLSVHVSGENPTVEVLLDTRAAP